MPPKKKVKAKKRKVTNKNTNVNTQTVIVHQAPAKRKYNRRKTAPVQPKSQFSTPETATSQIFNLLRFIPTHQPPNYQSIQNTPQPIPMLENKPTQNPFLLGNILERPDIEGSEHDIDERFDELPEHDKYGTLQPEGSGGGAELKTPMRRPQNQPSSASPAVTRAKRNEKTSSLSIEQIHKELASARRAVQKFEGADDTFQSDPKKIKTYKQNQNNIKRLEAELSKRD